MSIPPIGRSFEAIQSFFKDDSNTDNTQPANTDGRNSGNVGYASVGGPAISTVVGVNEVGKRPLTGEEREIVEEYFGESIDLDRVTINEFSVGANVNALFNENGSRPYVIGNTVNYSRPINLDNPVERSTFLHEMTHVWQYQNTRGPGVQLDGAVFEADDFLFNEEKGQQYIIDTTKLDDVDNFHDFNIEQQAEVVRGYDLLQRHAELTNELDMAGRWGHTLTADEIKTIESDIKEIEEVGTYKRLNAAGVQPDDLEKFIEEIQSHRPANDGIAYEASEAFDEIANSPTPILEIAEGTGEVAAEAVESAGENIWNEGKEVYEDLTNFPWGRLF